MKILLSVFIVLLLSANVLAATDCNLTLQNIRLENTAANRTYDIFNVGNFSLLQNHLIDIKNNSTEFSCDTVLLIKPSENFYKSISQLQKLNFQILSGKEAASFYENGLAIVIRNLQPNENRTISYQMKFPSGQYVPYGIYRNKFNFSAVEFPLNRTNIYYVLDSNLDVKVEKVAKISLWGTSNPYQHTVDFGELRSGKSHQVTPRLLVQSSSDYSINFYSDYNGHLRHRSGDSRWDVNYDFFVNNRLVPLDSGTYIEAYKQPANAVGDRFSMMFKLGDVSSKPAGNYSDVITITVTPSLVY